MGVPDQLLDVTSHQDDDSDEGGSQVRFKGAQQLHRECQFQFWHLEQRKEQEAAVTFAANLSSFPPLQIGIRLIYYHFGAANENFQNCLSLSLARSRIMMNGLGTVK